MDHGERSKGKTPGNKESRDIYNLSRGPKLSFGQFCFLESAIETSTSYFLPLTLMGDGVQPITRHVGGKLE